MRTTLVFYSCDVCEQRVMDNVTPMNWETFSYKEYESDQMTVDREFMACATCLGGHDKKRKPTKKFFSFLFNKLHKPKNEI